MRRFFFIGWFGLSVSGVRRIVWVHLWGELKDMFRWKTFLREFDIFFTSLKKNKLGFAFWGQHFLRDSASDRFLPNVLEIISNVKCD